MCVFYICQYVRIFEDMVDTIQTKEGAVAISAENVRSSMRSVRRGKTKMILTPASLASHVLFILLTNSFHIFGIEI